MKRYQVEGGGWVTGGTPEWRWLWFIPGQLGRLFRVHPENSNLLLYAGSLSGQDDPDWRSESDILSDVEWWNPLVEEVAS